MGVLLTPDLTLQLIPLSAQKVPPGHPQALPSTCSKWTLIFSYLTIVSSINDLPASLKTIHLSLSPPPSNQLLNPQLLLSPELLLLSWPMDQQQHHLGVVRNTL